MQTRNTYAGAVNTYVGAGSTHHFSSAFRWARSDFVVGTLPIGSTWVAETRARWVGARSGGRGRERGGRGKGVAVKCLINRLIA